MALAKLPLLSASAQGSIGKCLTFSRRSGKNKVRYQRRQADALTDYQIPRRLLITQGVLNWQAFSAAEKAVYNTRAKELTMSGYNLYLQEYLLAAATPEKRSRHGERTYGYYEYGRQAI